MAQCSYLQLARLRAAYAEDPWLKPPIAFGLHLSRASARRLPAALSLLMRRHPILCATFPGPDGVEYHESPGPGDVRIESVDEPWTHESVLAKARSPFAPDEDRLYRFLVASNPADADGIVLVVAVDHLIFDGYSVEVFRRDLGALLAGDTDLDEAFGPALAYRRFVEEQDEFVNSPQGSAARRHWLRRWERSGLYPVLPQPDPPHDDNRPAVKHVSVAARVAGTVTRTVPGCAALATLAQAIHTCSGRPPDDGLVVTAITPYLNRSRSFLNSLGYFDNRLQVSVRAEGRPEQTLEKATAEWVNLLRYGQYPFELIVRELFVDQYAQRAASPYLFFTSAPQSRSQPATTPDLARFTDVESFKDYNSLTVSHERGNDGADLFDLIYNSASVSDVFVGRLAERMAG